MDTTEREGRKSKKAKPSSTTKGLYEENLYFSRIPKYTLDQRFDNDDTFSKRKPVNQYSKSDFEQDLDDTYAWLITNTKVQYSIGGGHFKCWIVDTTAIGMQLQNSGYVRVSFRGVYYMAHIFAWIYHNPGKKLQNDGSHLCGNQLCVRHIYDESHEYNISRRGCLGYLIDSNGHNILQHCTHIPPCKKTTLYFPENKVNLSKEN
jgi:hypothetical protein